MEGNTQTQQGQISAGQLRLASLSISLRTIVQLRGYVKGLRDSGKHIFDGDIDKALEDGIWAIQREILGIEACLNTTHPNTAEVQE